jgi:hypothetical protein
MKQDEKEGLDFRAEMAAIGARLAEHKKTVLLCVAIGVFILCIWLQNNQ